MGILRVLMNSVLDNFTHSVVSINRELNRAFDVTQTSHDVLAQGQHTTPDQGKTLPL